MNTRLIYMVLLIVCFSCNTNNEPVSDTQKEKIKGEVKDVVTTIFKAFEEVNSDLFIAALLDSPDFVYISNGRILNYKECIDSTKIESRVLKNQSCLKLDEKYVVLNNSTVLYTANSKWLMNLKDGSALIQDPELLQILFKKTDSKWEILNFVESGVSKTVKNREPSKELNQVELMKQFIGTWKCLGKDTTFIWECKAFGSALEFTIKTETKGKITIDAKTVMGYDEENDRLIESVIDNNSPDISLCPCWFTSAKTFEQITLKDIGNPEKATLKWVVEFKSHDSFVTTEINNNKVTGSESYIRVK